MAADPAIVRYIKEQMGAGFRKAQIYDALLRAGWYKEEIDAAFYEMMKQSSFAPEPQIQPTDAKQPKPKKRRSRKKIAAVAILAVLALLAAMVFLGFFNPLDYLLGSHDIIPQGPGKAEGFSKMGISDWHYRYDGSFSVTFQNLVQFPITINTVTAECGQENPAVLETLEPTHLEPEANITYSTGNEKCLLKEPQESYSVAIIIRYIDENNAVVSSTGVVSGTVE